MMPLERPNRTLQIIKDAASRNYAVLACVA
jgi:hypothetical protein